mgnify:FL=1
MFKYDAGTKLSNRESIVLYEFFNESIANFLHFDPDFIT